MTNKQRMECLLAGGVPDVRPSMSTCGHDGIASTRQSIELGGPWRFCPDPHRDGETTGFWRDDLTFPMWGEVPVPSCFEAAGSYLDGYEGICWYRRSFAVPAAWMGGRAVLRFEAVNYRARVWLNGKFLGEHRDGFLPFQFAVGDIVRCDSANLLAVAVDNSHHDGDVPGMHVGWRGFGGIIREVLLEMTSMVHLDRPRVYAEPVAGGGTVEIRTRVHNHGAAEVDGIVETVIEEHEVKALLLRLKDAGAQDIIEYPLNKVIY